MPSQVAASPFWNPTLTANHRFCWKRARRARSRIRWMTLQTGKLRGLINQPNEIPKPPTRWILAPLEMFVPLPRQPREARLLNPLVFSSELSGGCSGASSQRMRACQIQVSRETSLRLNRAEVRSKRLHAFKLAAPNNRQPCRHTQAQRRRTDQKTTPLRLLI